MDLLMDAFLDTAKVWPLLYIVYAIFEWVEHKQINLCAKKELGPIAGALSGCIPQCGASIAASSLYSGRVITLGTLLAVFIATSDEAIPLMFTHVNQWKMIALLVIIKVIYASFVGILIDLLWRGERSELSTVSRYEYQKEKSIFIEAFERSVKVLVFLFIMTFLINLVISWIGEDTLARGLMTTSYKQPFLAALIGLIPNCAASVLLTDLYLKGMITFGSLLAGLCTGVGAGLLTLFKMNKLLKENLVIIGLLYFFGVLIGLTLHILIIGI
ncbi:MULTISPECIES: putative manganese transporter [Turicibacter]|uniref:putative manganese transporter n=1 Tax=Turicibacter TaxID=191303 RepID=UPI0001FDB5A5|nr:MULTISPECIES: putative manganese transporter [Turicibacter]EGC92949.1 hypothetical protein HMPREF9402_2354 [Turicibacter sp. HGF1]